MIAINNGYQIAPFADLLYACDLRWWIEHFANVVSTRFAGEMWTVSQDARDKYGIQWISGQDFVGLSKNDTYIHTGSNSGYQAISLAYLFGCNPIYLLGFDMMATNGRKHWHKDHPPPLANGGNMPNWVHQMGFLARDLKAAGVRVINCSRHTALRCFERSTIQEVFA